MPETSIIIVSHNGLRQTTAPCLESIFANSAGSDFKVIVVDNNSSDDTPAYLNDMMEDQPRLRCIFNKSNRGFAGGNNDGLRIASSEFVVLLNSDTLVTGGWLDGLTNPLSNDSSIGLTGPVSNVVGTEQQIFTSGKTPEEILQEGLLWASRSGGSRFEVEMLSFFCVAMRRDVIEKAGMLDEGFELGYYEDEDYCLRARSAGYRLVCVEEVFVYHKGSGSFGADVGKMAFMKRNRERFKKMYPAHPVRILHPYGQMKRIEGYINEAMQTGMSADLRYRVNNRMKMIESYKPGRLGKRIKFHRMLRRLRNSLEKCGYH